MWRTPPRYELLGISDATTMTVHICSVLPLTSYSLLPNSMADDGDVAGEVTRLFRRRRVEMARSLQPHADITCLGAGVTATAHATLTLTIRMILSCNM